MAKPKQLSNKAASKFLCCFGLIGPHESGSISAVDRVDHAGCDHHHREIKKKDSRITVRLFPFMKLRVKSNTKTVPLSEREIRTVQNWSKPKKSKSKSKTDDDYDQSNKLTVISISPTIDHEVVTVVPTSPDKKPKEKEKPIQNTNLENHKTPTQLTTSKEDTCLKRLSFSRKLDAIRKGSSQPSSPTPKPVRAIKHSDSFPVNRPKPTTSPRKSTSREKRVEPVVKKRFEPVVGMSIVMVTLLIMVMWGRIFAILCTSAWLYFVPRLSTAVVDPSIKGLGNGSGSGGFDLGSEEYKKKVVFEGFLERNNRNS